MSPDPTRMERRVRRALARAERAGPNFELPEPGELGPDTGWRLDDHRISLPGEHPGPPEAGGSWQRAVEVARTYAFADPRIVTAVHRLDEPVVGRTMVLVARFLWLHFLLAVRIGHVVDEVRAVDGRAARVWGWNYHTLDGHLEQGQMDYQVWKWQDTGAVEFRIAAFSRRAPIPNPIVRLGFALFGRMMQRRFIGNGLTRMRDLVVGTGRSPAHARRPLRG